MSVHESLYVETNDPEAALERLRATNHAEGDHYRTPDGVPFYASVYDGTLGLLSFNYCWIPATAILTLLKPPQAFTWMVHTIEQSLLFEGDVLAWRQAAKDDGWSWMTGKRLQEPQLDAVSAFELGDSLGKEGTNE